jgi:hypothetical protein
MNKTTLALLLFVSCSATAQINSSQISCSASGAVDGITHVDAAMNLYNLDLYQVKNLYQNGSVKMLKDMYGNINYAAVMIDSQLIESDGHVKQTFIEKSATGIYSLVSYSTCQSRSDGDCIGTGSVKPQDVELSRDLKVHCQLK